jgi:hypothetical protein
MYLSGIGLQAIYKSFRMAERELRDPVLGRAYVEIVAAAQAPLRPDWPFSDVGRAGSQDAAHDAERDRCPPHLGEASLREAAGALRKTAADIARDVGYGDPNGRGSINRPVRERYHTTDGKVTAVRGSPYRTGPTRSGLKGGPQPTATNCRPTTAAASQAASPTTPPSKRPPVGLVGHVPHPCPSVTDAQA